MQWGRTALIGSAIIGSEDITDLLLNVTDINVMKKTHYVSLSIERLS